MLHWTKLLLFITIAHCASSLNVQEQAIFNSTTLSFLGDRLGSAVAIYKNVAVAGAFTAGSPMYTSGLAYVYVFNGTAWNIEATLMPSNGMPSNDNFGISVAIHNNTIVVGAPGNKGQAYVFVRTPNTSQWVEQAILSDPDGASGQSFGQSVSVYQDTIVVGEYFKTVESNEGQGQVFIYSRSENSWALQQTLGSSDLVANDYFGYSVAMYKTDRIVVGACNKNSGKGEVYIFVRKTINGAPYWEREAQLSGHTSSPQDFGRVVAIHGDTVVVGSPNKAYATIEKIGVAGVFVRDPLSTFNAGWSQQRGFIGNSANNLFGSSVAVYGDVLLIGSSGVNTKQGRVNVYVRSNDVWPLESTPILASDGTSDDSFGASAALYGDIAIIGAPDNQKAGALGSTYIYSGLYPCPTSYTWSMADQNCQLNQCSINNGGCENSGSIKATCIDNDWLSDNGVVCTCPTNYAYNTSTNTCEFNQCLSNNGGCDNSGSITATCVDNDYTSDSGVQCTCPTNYLYDTTSNTCQFDQCTIGNGGCDTVGPVTASCHDNDVTSDDGVFCTCSSAGYWDNTTSGVCQFDQCDLNNGGCDHDGSVVATCIDIDLTMDSDISCYCPDSYTYNTSAKQCQFDQCSFDNGGCDNSGPENATCVDNDHTIDNSVVCACFNPSYSYNTTSNTCLFNECTVENGGCHMNATCVDNDRTTNTGVVCQCSTGYFYNTASKACEVTTGDNINEEGSNSSASHIEIILLLVIPLLFIV